MWWGKGSSDKTEAPKDKPSAPPSSTGNVDPRKDASNFDPEKLPDHRKLPKGLQNIVDKADHDDNFFDELVDG